MSVGINSDRPPHSMVDRPPHSMVLLLNRTHRMRGDPLFYRGRRLITEERLIIDEDDRAVSSLGPCKHRFLHVLASAPDLCQIWV